MAYRGARGGGARKGASLRLGVQSIEQHVHRQRGVVRDAPRFNRRHARTNASGVSSGKNQDAKRNVLRQV